MTSESSLLLLLLLFSSCALFVETTTNHLQAVKMLAWEGCVRDRIDASRAKEVSNGKL